MWLGRAPENVFFMIWITEHIKCITFSRPWKAEVLFREIGMNSISGDLTKRWSQFCRNSHAGCNDIFFFFLEMRFLHFLILQAYGEWFCVSLLIVNKGEKRLTEVSSFYLNRITSPRRDFFICQQNMTVKLLYLLWSSL